jgi:hypothetical protein
MLKAVFVFLSFFALFEPTVHAQDWAAVQLLPPNTPVRIAELGGSGREIRGRIDTVDEKQLMLRRGSRIVPVPRTSIARIDQERRDPIWEGVLFGALYAVAMRIAFADEACARWPEPQCSIAGIALSAAAGGFIDFQIRGYRRIYNAPATTVTVLRWSF